MLTIQVRKIIISIDNNFRILRLTACAKIHTTTSIVGAIFEKHEIEKTHNNAFYQQKANASAYFKNKND